MASERENRNDGAPSREGSDRLPDIEHLNQEYRARSERRHVLRLDLSQRAVEERRWARVSEALDDYIVEAQARGRSRETVRRTALACFLCSAL
jgi:hypothetical protein